MFQNYPNPFNPQTVIGFSIPENGYVTLYIYDLLGRKIAGLIDKEMGAGSHRVTWDASGNPGGVYLYRLTTESGHISKKLILIK